MKRQYYSLLEVILLLTISYSFNVNGETKTWVAKGEGRYLWNTDELWDLFGIPKPFDDVIINEGLFQIIIDKDVEITYLRLGVPCGVCSPSNSDTCTQSLIIASGASLRVEKGIEIETFGELVVYSNAYVETKEVSCHGSIRGSGEITAEVTLNKGATLDPYDYDMLSNIATFTINGNLMLGNSTIVIDVVETKGEYLCDVVNITNSMSSTSGIVENILMLMIQNTITTLDRPITPFLVNGSTSGFFVFSYKVSDFGPRLTSFNCSGNGIGPGKLNHGGTSAPVKSCQIQGGGKIEIILNPSGKECCPTGWEGTSCETPQCGFCIHGVCEYDLSLKTPPTCLCDEGWDGSDCNTAVCPLGSNGKECSLRGTCDASTSTPRCVCDNGWSGTSCSQGSCPNNCSAHGTCRTDVQNIFCDCNPGYTGGDCSEITLTCQNNCSGHGTCNNVTCECLPDWGANDCSLALCNGSPSCGLRGTCNSLNGTHYCECDAGWKGSDCTIGYCPNDCTGNGECLTTKEVPVCSCNDGKTGEDCSQDIQYGLSDDDNKSSTVSRDVIIGVVVGGVGVVILGMVGVVIYRKRQKDKENSDLSLELSNKK